MCLFSSWPIYLIAFVKPDIPLYLGLNGIFIPCPTPQLLIWESAFFKVSFLPKIYKGKAFYSRQNFAEKNHKLFIFC